MNTISNKLYIVFFFIGSIMITIYISKNFVKCDKPKIIYKYIPRDFNIDSNYPEIVSSNFNDMFNKPTPYIVQL